MTNNNAWCGGYPYNLIVVAFAVIVFAIAGQSSVQSSVERGAERSAMPRHYAHATALLRPRPL